MCILLPTLNWNKSIERNRTLIPLVLIYKGTVDVTLCIKAGEVGFKCHHG